MEIPPIECNVCGTAVSGVLVTKDGFSVYQCADCGLAFTHPRPEFAAAQYDSSYFDVYRRRRRFRLKRADARLRRIELIREPGLLLDIGCSLGYFVEAANARGWRAVGLEISSCAADEARRLGVEVRTGVLERAGYADGEFDCVTMWDVLEHVPDPTRHMLEVRRILKPRGMVVIGTPNIAHPRFRLGRQRWRHLKPTEHVFYFQESSLHRLLAETGFELVSPRVLGGRTFRGSLGAVLSVAACRLAPINDVMIAYGVRNGLKIPQD